MFVKLKFQQRYVNTEDSESGYRRVNREKQEKVSARVTEWIKAEYLDKSKMGKANGRGVYNYPNPEFENPDSLKVTYQKEPQLQY